MCRKSGALRLRRRPTSFACGRYGAPIECRAPMGPGAASAVSCALVCACVGPAGALDQGKQAGQAAVHGDGRLCPVRQRQRCAGGGGHGRAAADEQKGSAWQAQPLHPLRGHRRKRLVRPSPVHRPPITYRRARALTLNAVVRHLNAVGRAGVQVQQLAVRHDERRQRRDLERRGRGGLGGRLHRRNGGPDHQLPVRPPDP